jgi:hypothetical protein
MTSATASGLILTGAKELKLGQGALHRRFDLYAGLSGLREILPTTPMEGNQIIQPDHTNLLERRKPGDLLGNPQIHQQQRALPCGAAAAL